MTSETHKAYLAGLIDGEGHVGITTSRVRPGGLWRSHYLIVTLSNTHIPTMAWVKSFWQGTLVIRQQPQQRTPIGNLRWSSAQATAVLKDIRRYSRIKAAQIELALQFSKIIEDRHRSTKYISEEEWNLREELRLAIRQLNRPDPSLKAIPYPADRYRKTCPQCGAEFSSNGTTKKYCVKSCYWKATNQRRSADNSATANQIGNSLDSTAMKTLGGNSEGDEDA